jgi:hypothetical protein
VDDKTEDASSHETHYLRTPTSVALGHPMSGSVRGDSISALGGKRTGCARVVLGRKFSFRLAVWYTTLLQIAPLYEIGKTVGLGLDLQIVDRGLGPVASSQQYLTS